MNGDEFFAKLKQLFDNKDPLQPLDLSGIEVNDENLLDLTNLLYFVIVNHDRTIGCDIDLSNNILTLESLKTLMMMAEAMPDENQIILHNSKTLTANDISHPRCSFDPAKTSKTNSTFIDLTEDNSKTEFTDLFTDLMTSEIEIMHSLDLVSSIKSSATMQELMEVDYDSFRQVVNSISNSFYDYQVIDAIANLAPENSNIQYYGSGDVRTHGLNEILKEFKASGKNTALFSLHVPLSKGGLTPNHFSVLVVQKKDDKYLAAYIDPTGLNTMPEDCKTALSESLAIDRSNITKTTNIFQYNSGGMLANVGCGPFTAHILYQLAQGKYEVDFENGILQYKKDDELFPVPNCSNAKQSNLIDSKLRKLHAKLLGSFKEKNDQERQKLLLEKLDAHAWKLSKMGIVDADCVFIIETLKQNQNIKSLILDDNNITDRGLESLLESLNETGIISIKLSKNSITTSGIVNFMAVLVKTSCKVTIATVDNNHQANVNKAISFRASAQRGEDTTMQADNLIASLQMTASIENQKKNTPLRPKLNHLIAIPENNASQLNLMPEEPQKEKRKYDEMAKTDNFSTTTQILQPKPARLRMKIESFRTATEIPQPKTASLKKDTMEEDATPKTNSPIVLDDNNSQHQTIRELALERSKRHNINKTDHIHPNTVTQISEAVPVGLTKEQIEENEICIGFGRPPKHPTPKSQNYPTQ